MEDLRRGPSLASRAGDGKPQPVGQTQPAARVDRSDFTGTEPCLLVYLVSPVAFTLPHCSDRLE